MSNFHLQIQVLLYGLLSNFVAKSLTFFPSLKLHKNESLEQKLEDEETDLTPEMQLHEELLDVDLVEQLLLDEQQDTTLLEVL